MSRPERQMERPESSDDVKVAGRVVDSWPRWKQNALASVFGVSFSALRSSSDCQTANSTNDHSPK